eukprot:jgi/Mesvir1/26257/Mv01620-RA.1
MRKAARVAFIFALLCSRVTAKVPDRVFCVGFNKTGTRTLARLLGELGKRCCHDFSWAYQTRRHNATYFEQSACSSFADGYWINYAWLAHTFPGSAFVLNTRPLESWLISRHAHVESNHAHSKPANQHARNTPDDVCDWIRSRERTHRDILRFFGCTHPRGRVTNGDIFSVNVTQGPPALFTVIDVVKDGSTVVKQQLARLLRGQVGRGNHKVGATQPNDAENSVHEGTRSRDEIDRSSVCVLAVLNALALSPAERAEELLLGRTVPLLPPNFNGSACPG